MALSDQITEQIDLFLDADIGFGESIEIWPEGDRNNAVSTTGVWDEDSLPGTNETQGDGRIMDDPDGRSDRKSVVVELNISHYGTNIRKTQPQTKPDKLKRVSDGTVVSVKRVLGTDVGMFSVLAINNDHVGKKRGRRIG